jgi:5-methylcytosine-specific restriction protein A
MTETPKMRFIPAITIGEVVGNGRIVDEFLCSPQGGMRRSKKNNCLVLVSKHVASSTKVYDDKVIDGVYHYTGQGMNGDQSLTFAQNKTLAESPTNNVALHFFEVFKTMKVGIDVKYGSFLSS